MKHMAAVAQRNVSGKAAVGTDELLYSSPFHWVFFNARYYYLLKYDVYSMVMM